MISNSNEQGLIIAKTTFGGLQELQHVNGILDYGSLIYLTLMTCKTVIEAIHYMDTMVIKYGYASTGESFSLGDYDGHLWIMELIGKGRYEKDAVWVTKRIPNGSISMYSHQSRITIFERNDSNNCLYSQDVVTFAQKYNLTQCIGDCSNFSFRDIYNPVTKISARSNEGRVFSIFFSVIKGSQF